MGTRLLRESQVSEERDTTASRKVSVKSNGTAQLGNVPVDVKGKDNPTEEEIHELSTLLPRSSLMRCIDHFLRAVFVKPEFLRNLKTIFLLKNVFCDVI